MHGIEWCDSVFKQFKLMDPTVSISTHKRSTRFLKTQFVSYFQHFLFFLFQYLLSLSHFTNFCLSKPNKLKIELQRHASSSSSSSSSSPSSSSSSSSSVHSFFNQIMVLQVIQNFCFFRFMLLNIGNLTLLQKIVTLN